MASLALHLKSHHHKPSQTLLKSTPSFTHFFSSSSSSDNNDNNNNNNNNNDDNGEKQYPFSGYFKDIKSKLKQHEQQRHQQQSPALNKPSPFNFTSQDSSNPSKKPESFEEIKKNLSEFRRRSSPDVPPSSPPQQQQQQIGLFQNVRNRSVGNPSSAAVNVQSKGGNLSFDAIRESLRQMKGSVGEKGIGNSNMSDKMSLNNYKKSLKLQQPTTMAANAPGAKVIGGSFENLPESVFGKEMREKERKEQGESGGAGSEGKSALDIQFLKSYNYDELGDKLRELRPEMKEKNGGEGSWFSLSELNERVKKLKEIEEKQLDHDKIGSAVYGDLRKSLQSLKDENEKKSKPVSMQGLNMLPSSGFTQSPPKDHLIEKYFHPDNMSAEEKLKLELKKVRDEFKMHESDCGSTRVQIAQLTTEILHLSSVLHKKDKHSRKGLQAKVQQRKKLLKYLRRTDWESYIFVLSKLGLRDNPDYKN